MSNFSDENSFENILNRMLSKIPENIDKREGSIIYDALAPAAAELAQCYIALDVYTDQTYLLNAVNQNLDNRVLDYGLTRNSASFAQRQLTIYNSNKGLLDVPIGTRFSVPNAYGGYNFKIIKITSLGNYIAECETAGIVGNDYLGELLPLSPINNLGSAILGDVTKPGENEETDDELRARAFNKINQEAFSGNKAAYKQLIENMDGVEFCKVFPVWNGGGTVKLAVIASNKTIPSSDFITNIQNKVDPLTNSGEGIGLAPIGHKVTVVAPEKLNINISATLTIDPNYTVSQLKSSIVQNISTYIEEVQNSWSDEDTLIIYTSKIIAAILLTTQVKNVSNLKINNASTDLTIQLSGTNVKFPILNEVNIE